MANKKINPTNAVCEETGRSTAREGTLASNDDLLQQRILPRVLFVLNQAESHTSEVSRREFNERLALAITSEVMSVLNTLGNDQRMAPRDGPVDPVGEDAVDNAAVEEEDEGRDVSEDTQGEENPSGSELSSGPCEAWYEFVSPVSGAKQPTVESVVDSSSSTSSYTSTSSTEPEPTMSGSPMKRMKRLFSRKIAPASSESSSSLSQISERGSTIINMENSTATNSRSLECVPSPCPQVDGSLFSRRAVSLSSVEQMPEAFPFEDFFPEERHSEADGNQREIPRHLEYLLTQPFTEQSVMHFLEDTLRAVLPNPIYRGQTATAEEVYAQIMSMVRSLEVLHRLAHSGTRDFARVILEAIIRSVFNVPPDVLVLWGLPDGPRVRQEIPPEWDRQPVVEAQDELPRARENWRTRLCCPFRFPRFSFSLRRWLGRLRRHRT
ncbi:uncharacterized protein [Hoplias malabaricus]|uniref:uncharacterized protein n=1 Tax=Hoplias malabaricus TaxID=27720 RepID=UPI003462AD0D